MTLFNNITCHRCGYSIISQEHIPCTIGKNKLIEKEKQMNETGNTGIGDGGNNGPGVFGFSGPRGEQSPCSHPECYKPNIKCPGCNRTWIMKVQEDLPFAYYDSLDKTKRHFNEEGAISILLNEGILFCNDSKLVGYKFVKDDSEKGFHTVDGEIEDYNVVLYVNCNDLFYWGTADAEGLKTTELKELYDMWYHDNHWGSSKWCCKKRNLQPQVPVKEDMIKQGVWEEWMDKLPEPEPS